MEIKNRVLWTQWGEYARSILRQYNESAAVWPDQKFWGPHYVTYREGEFEMHPFGVWMEDYYRYSFEVRPEFIPGAPEPLWTFVVMV